MRKAFGVACVLVAVLLPATLAAQVVPEGDKSLLTLHRELERIAAELDGVVGVAAHHLETGRKVFLNPGEPYPMASTYKVPIAVQLLTRVDRGEIALTDMVDVTAQDLHPGSGILTRLFDDPGVSLSVHNLLELMLLISDNSATDMTLALAGGADAVNARMAEIGVTGLHVDRPTSILIGDLLGVETPTDGRISMEEFSERRGEVSDEAEQEARDAFGDDPRDTSTPEAMARVLEAIWNGEALSPESTELVEDILLRVETGRGRIRGVLPPDVDVGHKTGTIGGTTNDVGYLYLPDDGGHVITVIFVKDAEEESGGEREATIAHLARAIYDYFLFNRGM